jgi:hypothetical protein
MRIKRYIPNSPQRFFFFWRTRTYSKNVLTFSVWTRTFCFLNSSEQFWLKSECLVSKRPHSLHTFGTLNTLLTCHAYDYLYSQQNTTSLSDPLEILCSPFLTTAFRFNFVRHGFYLGDKQSHVKHKPLIMTTSRLSTVLCLPWTFLITKLTI